MRIEEIIDYPVITNKMNKFEKSRMIAARAQQLANDATPLIDIENEIDMVKIAEEEFDAGLLDFIEIIRKYPNGKSV
jgi:DNA-directed RNA polymerase subunit K/omega